MRKADRLFQLTNLIRARQPVTARQLAEELGVSVRSIYRYIDDLSVSGIPVYGIAGEGYRLHEGFELPPLNLTEKEIDALMLGIRMVTTRTGSAFSEAARSLEHKVLAVLPERLSGTYREAAHVPAMTDEKENRFWESMHGAVKARHPVRIDYHSLEGRRTSRLVYPLGMFYWGGKWTVGCWCTLRRDFRDFRLDRIVSLHVCDGQWPQREEISLSAYLASVSE